MSTATVPTLESMHFSLIDDLLELRDNPFPRTEEELLAMLADVDRSSPAWRAHFAAIDSALDLLVPALQRVLEAVSPLKEHQGCLTAEGVRGIIGHVPRRAEGRYRRGE